MAELSEGRRFTKESFIYVIGEMLSRSLAVILLPVFAAYLSEPDVAALLIIGMIWPLLVTVMGRAFSAYVMRGYYDSQDGPRFFGTVLLFSLSIAVGTGLLLHLAGPWLSDRIFTQYDYRPYLQYAVYFSIFRLFFTHVLSIYRTLRKALMSVILSTVLFALNAAAIFIAIYGLKTDLQGILNAQLIAYACVALVYIVAVHKEISLKWLKGIVGPALKYVLPLYPHSVSAWILIYVSTIFIENHFSANDVAVYGMAQRLALIMAIINIAFNQGWSPFIYANAKKENFQRLFQTNARKLILFTLFACAMIILFSKELLLMMQKESYMAAREILPILLIAYFFQLLYMVYVVHLFYHKNTKLIPFISISTGIIAFMLNWWLVPKWGMYGGAFCTVISFLLMALMAYGFSKRYVHVRVLNWKIAAFIVALTSVVAGVYFITEPMGILAAVGIKILTGAVVFLFMEWLGLFSIKVFLKSFFIGRSVSSK